MISREEALRQTVQQMHRLREQVKRLEDQLGEAMWNYGEAVRKQQAEYERGFVDGMQQQAKSSVDRAVNAMANAAKGRAL